MVELVLTTDLVTPHEIFLRLTFGRRLKLRGVCGRAHVSVYEAVGNRAAGES